VRGTEGIGHWRAPAVGVALSASRSPNLGRTALGGAQTEAGETESTQLGGVLSMGVVWVEVRWSTGTRL